MNWASKIGPYCGEYIKGVLQSRKYPEQGYRACLGILRLSNSYPHEKVEQACKRGLSLKVYSYKFIEAILKRKTDRPVKPKQASSGLYQQPHENVRGSLYYK